MGQTFSLAGRKGIVFGTASPRSIAWSIAESLAEGGAEVGLTYQNERVKGHVAKLAEAVKAAFLRPCDVTNDAEVDEVFRVAGDAWGGLDFLVHSLAYADTKDLEGGFADTSREGFLVAHEVSTFSLTQLCRRAAPLMGEGGSILALSFLGSERVVPGYNVMGVAKAGLESSARYLAHDLGPRGIRVNVISAGPIKTLSSMAISGFSLMQKHVRERAPLRRNVTSEEVGATARFLLSGAASAITGEVIHVDCGYHVLGL